MKFKFESDNKEITSDSEKETKAIPPFGKTSGRLMRPAEITLNIQFRAIEINGKENLEKIPKGRKVVVVPTHISDADVPLTVYALGNELDLAISDMSVHHTFADEPSTNIIMHLIGKDNFLPVDFTGKGKEKHPTAFNPNNFIPMMKAMDDGKAMVVAGHNPSIEGHLERGGYGAVYLAEMTDAIILPVSINILSEENLGMAHNVSRTFLKRPDASVQIGEPFSLDKIEGIERIKELMDKRKSGGRLTHEEFYDFSMLVKNLKEKSEVLMNKLAEITPMKKRGDFGRK